MSKKCKSIRTLILSTAVLLTASAWATDGVIEINQARALAGGVTAGDTAGFPVTISVPGSYRLTGNLTVPDANTTAINIRSDNVSLDLNGFTIAGPNTCNLSAGPPAVTCTANGSGVGVFSDSKTDVRNGIIRGFGSEGIIIFGGKLTDLRVSESGGIGVRALTNPAIVHRVISEQNGGAGFNIAAGIVAESAASRNGNRGLVLDDVSATGIVAKQNIGQGIYLGNGVIVNSVSTLNWDDGIKIGSRAVVVDSLSYNNGGVGLHTGGCPTGYHGNTIQANTGGQVTGAGALQTGPNVCGAALCP